MLVRLWEQLGLWCNDDEERYAQRGVVHNGEGVTNDYELSEHKRDFRPRLRVLRALQVSTMLRPGTYVYWIKSL